VKRETVRKRGLTGGLSSLGETGRDFPIKLVVGARDREGRGRTSSGVLGGEETNNVIR